jgi:hypothetical protein
MNNFKETMFGTILGFFASIIAHILGLLFFSALVLATGVIALAFLRIFMTPDLAEALGLLVAIFGLPVGIFTGLMLISTGKYTVTTLLPIASGAAILLGLVTGGLSGHFHRHPIFKQRACRYGALIGLGVNLLALVLIALFTSNGMYFYLPGYLCIGPLTGILAVFFLKRALPG